MSNAALTRVQRRLPPAERLHSLVGSTTTSVILEERFATQLLSVSLSTSNPTNNAVCIGIPGGLKMWVGPKATVNRDVYFGAVGPPLAKIELQLPEGFNEQVDYTILYAPREEAR